MSNPMERQDVKEAILAALDALADDKKAANQALARITAVVEQSYEVTKQGHKMIKQGHKITKQSYKITKQGYEITKQSHKTTEQVREIANLAVERLKANDKQHETLIRLVKALDIDS